MPDVQLLRVDDALARALLSGDDAGLALAEGYPHADTADALGVRTADAHTFLVLADGVAIGDCGTHGGPNERGVVEIGYGLAAPWRGRGYGTATVRALVAALRTVPEVRVLTAEVELANEPSWRVLERVGFARGETTERTRAYELEL